MFLQHGSLNGYILKTSNCTYKRFYQTKCWLGMFESRRFFQQIMLFRIRIFVFFNRFVQRFVMSYLCYQGYSDRFQIGLDQRAFLLHLWVLKETFLSIHTFLNFDTGLLVYLHFHHVLFCNKLELNRQEEVTCFTN